MSLSWRARRRWSLVILLVGLPIYIGVAIWLLSLFERPSLWVEFVIYVVLGVLWALPFRSVFRGIARPSDTAEIEGSAKDP